MPSKAKSIKKPAVVARASRPLSRERPAPASGRGQDARATAGETPALHRRPYAGAITLEMAPTNCFHFDASRANCFLPAAVRR